jgi:FixJ family two-component response regulator
MTSRLVHLIDDDRDVREALAFLLGTVGLEVAPYADAAAFLDRLPGLKPGCIVTDIRMPQLSGLRLQERLKENACDWPVIVVTGHGDVEACRRALKGGAVDFLVKPIDEQALIDAVHGALAALDAALAARRESDQRQRRMARLSVREEDVLRLIAEGRSTKEVARELGLSPRTVDTHRAHIAEKLQTNSVAEMVRTYLLARD